LAEQDPEKIATGKTELKRKVLEGKSCDFVLFDMLVREE
jgi:hypothetical protein